MPIKTDARAPLEKASLSAAQGVEESNKILKRLGITKMPRSALELMDIISTTQIETEFRVSNEWIERLNYFTFGVCLFFLLYVYFHCPGQAKLFQRKRRNKRR